MSQNTPLSAFSRHFVGNNGFDINVNLTFKARYLLKRRFPTMEHRIDKRTSEHRVIGYPGSEAQLLKQQTGALSK